MIVGERHKCRREHFLDPRKIAKAYFDDLRGSRRGGQELRRRNLWCLHAWEIFSGCRRSGTGRATAQSRHSRASSGECRALHRQRCPPASRWIRSRSSWLATFREQTRTVLQSSARRWNDQPSRCMKFSRARISAMVLDFRYRFDRLRSLRAT
jgi:hypothetical protein